jgi:hypothetical protein
MNLWKKDIVSWRLGRSLFLSVPFTWLLTEAEQMAESHRKIGKVFAGGPAIQLMGASWADDYLGYPFDYLSFHNPLATFTSRGCPNQCSFCAVPIIEGDLHELKEWKPGPIVCDNNFLACSNGHIEKAIDLLSRFPYVDFNQGLDFRILTPWHVDQLRRLQGAKIRFAFDHVNSEDGVKGAVDMCQKAGFKDIGVYVLLGFNDSPSDALYRLEKVREWGMRPWPMRYQPLDAIKKNTFVAPGWTEKELCRIMQYYSRLRFYDWIPFDEFHRTRTRPDRNKIPLSFDGGRPA